MPEIDKCYMLALKYYCVEIISSKGEVVLKENVNETDAVIQHLNYTHNITFTVNITVVDIEGQRSDATVTMETIGMYNI